MAIDSLCRFVSQPAVSSSATSWGGAAAGVFRQASVCVILKDGPDAQSSVLSGSVPTETVVRRPQALPKTEKNAGAAIATTTLPAQPASSVAVSRMVTGAACAATALLPSTAISAAAHAQHPAAWSPKPAPAMAASVRSEVAATPYSAGVASFVREAVPGDLRRTLVGTSPPAVRSSVYPASRAVPARQPSAVVLQPPSSSAVEGVGTLLSLAAAALQASPSQECSSPTPASVPQVMTTTTTTTMSRPQLPPAWVTSPQGAVVPTTYGTLGRVSRSATAVLPTGMTSCSAAASGGAATTVPAPIVVTSPVGAAAALAQGATTSRAAAAPTLTGAIASSPSIGSPSTVQRQPTHTTWRWQSLKSAPSAQSTSTPGSSTGGGSSSSSNSSPAAAVVVVSDPLPTATLVANTVARMTTVAPTDVGGASAVKVAVSMDAQDASRRNGSVARQRPPRLRPVNEPEPADVTLPDPEESQRRWKATPLQDGNESSSTSRRTWKILCYGDSLTAGYICWDEVSGKAVEEVGILPKFTPYGAALHEGLLAQGFATELVSVGLHGVTARQMVKDAGSALGLETKLKDERFDLVIIMAGSNDIYFGGTSELLQHIRNLHGMCHKRGVRTVALAPPYPDDDTWRQDVKEEVKAELAAWVKATPQVLTYVDPESEISRQAERHLWEPNEYLPLHLTSAGYVALGQRLLPHIVPLLSSLPYVLPARM